MEVRDGSGDPLGDSRRVVGLSHRSGTGRGTFWDIWDRSGEPFKGPGQIGEPSGKSSTSQETLREV